jgi:hypothetical protein
MTSYEYERDSGKVGAMIRHISGDVAKAFQDMLLELYSEDGELSEIGKICCRWHWIICKYAVNPYMMRGYISIIQTAYKHNINLEKIEPWKRNLRMILPEEFLMKMNEFTTQVPKLAIMDEWRDTEEKKEKKHSSEVKW